VTRDLRKLACLTRMLPSRPGEVWQRLATIAELRVEAYRRRPCTIEPVDWSSAISELSEFWHADIDGILREAALKHVEQEVTRLIRAMPPDAPFGSFQNGDLRLARLCYALARIIRPPAIVETGVCYGVTSAFLLQALYVNGGGLLHSIDLPPLGKDADQNVGRLIPAELRGKWTLHRGSSKTLLPRVLKDLGQISLFIHDSLHTYKNMKREFETVQPFLNPTAVVVSDDVQGNEAFREWVTEAHAERSITLHEEAKKVLLGVALFRRQPGMA
jgi:predicted O-methyltransferase YrrM